MSTFPKTRAAASYIARHGPGELVRAHASILLARLGACEDLPPGGDGGGVPAVLHGLLRDLVLAARDLAGPAWLAAASGDPDIAAFTALQAATPVLSSPAELDEIISRVLWARFAPPGTPRDDAGQPGPAPGPAAGHGEAEPSRGPTASQQDRFRPLLPGPAGHRERRANTKHVSSARLRGHAGTPPCSARESAKSSEGHERAGRRATCASSSITTE